MTHDLLGLISPRWPLRQAAAFTEGPMKRWLSSAVLLIFGMTVFGMQIQIKGLETGV